MTTVSDKEVAKEVASEEKREEKTEEVKEPKAKKVKMSEYPVAPEEDWPEAWLMPETVEDQCEPNKLEPNVPVTPKQMMELGINYWKMEDVDKYPYPVKSVPWDPSDAADPKLQALRDARGYSYADIITVHPDHLPEFEKKIAAFFEEHIHDAEEIRFILGGSGYFDVRDNEDRWVRVHVKKGDLMTLPEGIYHRFTCDSDRLIHAMRLFIGQPVWTPFNRPQEDHPSRKKYVEEYMGGEEKKTEDEAKETTA